MERTKKQSGFEHDYALDILRAMAALYIVGFWHHVSYIDLDVLKTPVMRSWAIIALGVFFIISAYLLTVQQLNNIKRCPTGKERWNIIQAFYIKRVLRIYPLYAIAVLMFFLAQIGVWSLFDLFASLTLVAALIDKSPLTLWFINVIFLYYLALPFLWFYVRTSGRIILVGAMTFIVLFVVHRLSPLIDERVYVYLPSMIFGLLLGKNSNILALIKRYFWVFISGFALIFMLLIVYFNIVSVANISVAMPILAFPFLRFLSEKITYIKKLDLFWKILVYASFSAYLFHRVVYKVIYYLSPAFTDQTGLAKIAIAVIAVIPATFVVSYIAQRVYDKCFGALK